MRPDVCFLGTCSVDIELGVGTTIAEEAAFKRVLVSQCNQIVLAVTNEKLGTASPFAVAAMRDIGRLVIEADAEPHKLASLQHSGVPLLIAD
ncbi:DNA-binding transcriptional repressor SrlR [compost metagenome]